MKKIIGAFALVSLAVGLASADVKFALNYRTQMIGFSRLIHAPANNADRHVNYWFQQTKGWNSATDNVSMTASNDFAGVTVRIDPTLDKENAVTTRLNQYNAYIRFAGFELGAGNWKDGRYNGAYQVKNDSDAGWYNGDLFGAVKLGSLYAGAITLAVDDMANFAGGDSASSAYLQWKGDIGNAEITAEGALIGIGASTWDEESTINTGFGIRLNAAFETWQTQFVFKTASNKATDSKLGEQRAFGLHFNPKALPVNLVFGGAIGVNNGNVTEMNLDLRLRKVIESVSITFYTNISHITNDCDYISALKTPLGAEYLTSAGTMEKEKVTNEFNSTSQSYNTHMWNMLGLRAQLSDRVFFLFSAGGNTSLRNLGTDHWTGSELFVAPGLQFMNGKSGIATYARLGWSHVGVKDYDKDGDGAEMSLVIPVVIRVRF